MRTSRTLGNKRPTILWLRQDLRLADNPALHEAVQRGLPVIPVFIWAPDEEGAWAPGGASRWWLHRSLEALAADLRLAGSRLVIRQGPSKEALTWLIAESGATAIYWSRRYEPAIRERDARLEESLKASGTEVATFNAALLHEPWTVRNQSGKPFQVFTPFWRHCLGLAEPNRPLKAPAHILAPKAWPASNALGELRLRPVPDWAGGLRAAWRPGESGAADKLARFVREASVAYSVDRDRPDLFGTSRLSPHLHFGEISPRQIWHAFKRKVEAAGVSASVWRNSKFLAELGWREFAHHLILHFPSTDTEPLRSEFNDFRWRKGMKELRAWQRGKTGYPFVDAGMRELWKTGWMHNRVRMVVASFLVKDLLFRWQHGARWFWDTLVDADLAQNTLGWQWTAGCGADAAPYFRVFNPTNQGEKFDPRGTYVRRWVPELARLPHEWIHRPSEAPPEILRRAGVDLGENYPEPIVNRAIAREVALEAYARIKTRAGGKKKERTQR